MKVANGYEYVAMLEEIAPKELATEGDPIGLQLGDLSKKVRKIMFTLDVLESVVEEAVSQNVDMIIAHHPFLFRPLKKIDMTNSEGRMIRKLIKHDIIVYAAHTNLDIANGGVNDILAELLQLENTEIIVPTHRKNHMKISVYVPEDNVNEVRLALMQNGAGKIGAEYEECSFQTLGTGEFKPSEKANPTIGEKGELTAVSEVKLEAVVPSSVADNVIKAVRIAHPYEEPAIDLVRLQNLHETKGLGRIGTLKKEMSILAFIEELKGALAINHVRFIGDPNKRIKKVAVIGGDGNKFIHDVKRSGADVFVTGDIYYHTGHDLLAIDLPTIDAGHNIEKVMKRYLKTEFEKRAENLQYEAEFVISEAHTDPFIFL